MLRSLILFIAILLGTTASSQQYNYLQYTVADGLPSNTIYDIKQDKEGFMWIATDAGLARFDGRRFQTFTVEDGLPSNDVIILTPDGKGRIWVVTLSNSVCYYYQGKFHTSQNDSLLRRIHFNNTIWFITENDNGDIAFSSALESSPEFYVLTTDNKLIKDNFPPSLSRKFVFNSGGKYISTGRGSFLFFAGEGANEFIAQYLDVKNQVLESYSYDGKWKPLVLVKKMSNSFIRYTFNGERKQLKDSVVLPPNKNAFLYQAWSPTKKLLFYDAFAIDSTRSTCTIDKGRTALFICSNKGVAMFDTATGNIIDRFLTDKMVNRCYRDMEDNIWAATEKDGVIMIPSRSVKSFTVEDPDTEIISLVRENNTTYAGSSFSRLFAVSNGQIGLKTFKSWLTKGTNYQFENRLRWIEPVDHQLIMGFDSFIIRYDPASKKEIFSPIGIIKNMSVAGKDSIAISTGWSALLLNSRTLTVLDTIYPMRTYCIIKDGSNYYAGTPGGPVKITPGKPPFNFAEVYTQLHVMVNRFVKDPDGSLWMSTYGKGVFKIRNDSIVYVFNSSNGLNSNNCKAMIIDDKFLWIGTEKGINRINRRKLSDPVLHYTKEDGLASNDIHCLYQDSTILYVATGNKITWFDTSKIRSNTVCYLRLLNIKLGNRTVMQDSLLSIPYNDNNIRFDFTGISFRSSNNLLYFYKVKGLSDAWDSTQNTNLEFLALPHGIYQLEMFARNKFGQVSNTITIPFVINPPFWSTWWFRILMVVIAIGFVWWIIHRRIRREQEKAATISRINELEQQALRSQMNPHFIFNCLNSIQNFLLHSDFEKTNEYLSAFAHLIRQTLDNSSRSSISIDGEIRYLNSYLELECMRFAHTFSYKIEVDPDIDATNTDIPTMILQPYVENAIRHGLRYRQEGKKEVKVIFQKRGNTLLCKVDDTGVGRKKAAELKSFLHVEYQSKGMKLTADRIEAINRQQKIPITVDVIDKVENGIARGTLVVVRFPDVFQW